MTPTTTTATASATNETGPWDHPALEQLREWDPAWTEACVKVTASPWTSGVLPRKMVELISLAINAQCSNLNPEGTRRHIRAALEAGATREEILMVLEMASFVSQHSYALGAPILIEEAKAAGVKLADRPGDAATPICDKMRAAGQWNKADDPCLELDPAWMEPFMAVVIGVYSDRLMTPKFGELVNIAFNASFTNMSAPGTRRHIQNALKAGVTVEEIKEVLKLCVAQGVQTFNLGVPILVEEIARLSAKPKVA
jgi:alkylhydroperoxidase/carboxymuconolactone decarboxylase family protein YurZ